MKKIILLPIFFFLFAESSFSKPKPQGKEVVILSDKKHVVYFKVNKSFVGGLVEIYDEDKNFLEGDTLPHTHTIIYFDEMPAGHYTVKVIKGEKAAEFSYDNL